MSARRTGFALALALASVVAACGGRQSSSTPSRSLVLHTHASGAELLVPAGWAVAIDGHYAAASNADGSERVTVKLYALPPDRARRRQAGDWDCEEGTLVEHGPYYGTCTQEDGDVQISLMTVSRQPHLSRLREIAESVHGFTYRPPSDDRFADVDCGAALARMRSCVVKATLLELDREPLLARLDDKALTCEQIASGHRETVRELGCPPPPPVEQ